MTPSTTDNKMKSENVTASMNMATAIMEHEQMAFHIASNILTKLLGNHVTLSMDFIEDKRRLLKL